MKFRVMSCQYIRSMPVNTLRGMDRPITTVGRMVLNMPRMNVGRMVSMKAKTTDTANRKPNVPSCTRVLICPWISGPVGDDDDVDVPWYAGNVLEHVLDGVGHVQGVGLCLFRYGYSEARLAVSAGDAGWTALPERDHGHIRQTHRTGLTGPHDKVVEFLDRVQRVRGLGDECLGAVEQEPRGQGDVVLSQSGGDLEEGDTIGLHRCQVGRHCDVALDTAQQLDAQHSLKLLHLRDDEVFPQALDLGKGSVGKRRRTR